MHNPLFHTLLSVGIGLVGQAIQAYYPDEKWITPATILAGLGFIFWAAFLLLRERAPTPPGHETDAAEALRYIQYDTTWAEREHRKLNFRTFVDPLHDLRRGAIEDGLRTSGIPRFGGLPEPINSRHWDAAQIDRETASRRGGVCTKALVHSLPGQPEYCALKVTTEDMLRIWPRASVVSRAITATWILCKRVYYLWTPDARANRRRRWRTIRDNVRE